MAGAAKGRARKVEPVPEPEAGSQPKAVPEHTAGTCPVAWCPICLAISTVQPLKPDVVEHLLKAGSELMLAFRAAIDARADEVAGKDRGEQGGPRSSRLEKIDLA